VDITLDAAYAAGGYSLPTQALGLGANGVILGVIPMTNPGFIMDWDPAGNKLRARDASGAVGAATPEAANNLAALNGLVVRCFVLGKGSPG
jgi:hypothetical protein